MQTDEFPVLARKVSVSESKKFLSATQKNHQQLSIVTYVPAADDGVEL
jgi:hypothetical protein